MEHQGLAHLGTRFTLEAMQSKGSRSDVQRLLSEHWGEQGGSNYWVDHLCLQRVVVLTIFYFLCNVAVCKSSKVVS